MYKTNKSEKRNPNNLYPQAISYVLNFFPNIEPILNGNKSNMLFLSEVEKTFLNMCLFFKEPDKRSFDFRLVYKNLNDEWVIVALKALEIFSKKDCYLIKKPTHTILTYPTASYK